MACLNVRLENNWPMYLDYNKDILYVRLADKVCQYSPSTQNPHVFTPRSDTKWTLTNTSSPVHATSIDGDQSWVLMRKKVAANATPEHRMP
eukprot:15260594-Ditylum_brightwellii.AAC.1